MITIQNIGQFDTTKPFFEQEDEAVNAYLIEKTSQFSDFTALKRDNWNRPYYWVYDGEGIRITSERTYSTEDGNYFVKNQTFNLVEDGNI